MNSAKRETLKLLLIGFWLLFTVTFAVWWFSFSLEHISRLAELEPAQLEHWERQKRMVLWEGGTWLMLLVCGGAALILLVQKEKRRVRQIREFFASFTHDVKTSLASLRVQAEALADDWNGPESPILQRLIGDTVRLQLQLENSLFLASQDDLKLFIQPIRLSDLIERLREQWPALRFEVEGDAILRGDERALRTIFSNLAKNALAHGKASEMKIKVDRLGTGRLRLHILDNGDGFTGALPELGQLFHRPKSSSGSGVGLYISRLLSRRMGGDLGWHAGNHGFRLDLDLPGEAT